MAVAAREGETASGVVVTLADWLMAPIVLAHGVLPEAIAPGFSPFALLINSLVWASAVVGLVVCWRRWRHRPHDPTGLAENS